MSSGKFTVEFLGGPCDGQTNTVAGLPEVMAVSMQAGDKLAEALSRVHALASPSIPF